MKSGSTRPTTASGRWGGGGGGRCGRRRGRGGLRRGDEAEEVGSPFAARRGRVESVGKSMEEFPWLHVGSGWT